MSSLLLCAATDFEIQPLAQALGLIADDTLSPPNYLLDYEIQVLVTGPGMVQTCFGLTRAICQSRPSAILHVGIAGGRPGRFQPGDVVQVKSDFFADTGAETAEGELLDMFNMGLWKRNEEPFKNGIMENPLVWKDPHATPASGATVNRIPGTKEHQMKLALHRDYDVESMEGAAVFYTARKMGLPFYCLRGISNPIEPRNLANWSLEEAVLQVSKAAERLIKEWPFP